MCACAGCCGTLVNAAWPADSASSASIPRRVTLHKPRYLHGIHAPSQFQRMGKHALLCLPLYQLMLSCPRTRLKAFGLELVGQTVAMRDARLGADAWGVVTVKGYDVKTGKHTVVDDRKRRTVLVLDSSNARWAFEARGEQLGMFPMEPVPVNWRCMCHSSRSLHSILYHSPYVLALCPHRSIPPYPTPSSCHQAAGRRRGAVRVGACGGRWYASPLCVYLRCGSSTSAPVHAPYVPCYLLQRPDRVLGLAGVLPARSPPANMWVTVPIPVPKHVFACTSHVLQPCFVTPVLDRPPSRQLSAGRLASPLGTTSPGFWQRVRVYCPTVPLPRVLCATLRALTQAESHLLRAPVHSTLRLCMWLERPRFALANCVVG
jgi:hypothetical protein